jgi:hypothetical protein
MPRNFESDEPSFNLVLHFARHSDRHLQEERAFIALQAVISRFASADRPPHFSSPSTAGEIYFAECVFRQEGPYFRHIKSISRPLKVINQTKKASPPHS